MNRKCARLKLITQLPTSEKLFNGQNLDSKYHHTFIYLWGISASPAPAFCCSRDLDGVWDSGYNILIVTNLPVFTRRGFQKLRLNDVFPRHRLNTGVGFQESRVTYVDAILLNFHKAVPHDFCPNSIQPNKENQKFWSKKYLFFNITSFQLQ